MHAPVVNIEFGNRNGGTETRLVNAAQTARGGRDTEKRDNGLVTESRSSYIKLSLNSR